jgi:hypothetical protein
MRSKPAFHAGNTASNPVGDATFLKRISRQHPVSFIVLETVQGIPQSQA